MTRRLPLFAPQHVTGWHYAWCGLCRAAWRCFVFVRPYGQGIWCWCPLCGWRAAWAGQEGAS